MPSVPGLRSCYAKVGRLVYFGRMLDKIRLHAAGRLPADYHANLGVGFDGRTCAFLGLGYPDLVARVKAGGTDEEILAWAHARGGPRTDDECYRWNRFMMKIGWRDDRTAVLRQRIIAYGLAVEHYQKYEVIWNGNDGTDIFFQNEMPYDPPSQAAWMEAPGVNGWAAFKVARNVRSFHGYGMGSYSYFNQGVDIYAANAFEVPSNLPAGSLHNLLTIFLSTDGAGGITNVVNNTGGSSTIANPDTPVTVVNYPQ